MIKKLLVLILAFICLNTYAQKTNVSPYSILGIGEEESTKTVEEMSMGGTGTVGSYEYQLSFTNPAVYSDFRLTTYSLAGQNKGLTVKDATTTQRTSNANLSYLALGVPLGEKGGFAFGLQPNTSVGYSIRNSILDSDGEISEISLYEGEGGTNRVFFGLGYKVAKGLSIGIEGDYVFGNIDNTITNQLRDVQLGTKYVTDARINGFGFKSGFLFKKNLKKDLYLSVGSVFSLKKELKSKGNEYLYSISLINGEIPRDTILSVSNTGLYKKPLKTNLGIGIGKELKWAASLDYSFQNAVELSGNLINRNPKLAFRKSNKLSVGGFYIPKYNSISSYWDRVIYRAGLRKEQTGIMVDGSGNGSQFNNVDDFGISFGVGLPMGNEISRLNLGFEFGKRGTTNNGLIQENYFNFKLGLSLSNKWFRKREIN